MAPTITNIPTYKKDEPKEKVTNTYYRLSSHLASSIDHGAGLLLLEQHIIREVRPAGSGIQNMAKTNKTPTAKPRRQQASLFDFWSKPKSSTDNKDGDHHGAKPKEEKCLLHSGLESVESVSSKNHQHISSGATWSIAATPRPTTILAADIAVSAVSPDDHDTSMMSEEKPKVERAPWTTLEKSQEDKISNSPATSEPTNDDEDPYYHAAGGETTSTTTTPASSTSISSPPPDAMATDASLSQNPASPEHPPGWTFRIRITASEKHPTQPCSS
jgi:hypothetical protein